MIKWLLTLVVALIVLTLCTPWLRKYRLGRLPGDFILRYKGREYYLPITTTVLLSLALTLLGRML
jgi:hypothetical protein